MMASTKRGTIAEAYAYDADPNCISQVAFMLPRQPAAYNRYFVHDHLGSVAVVAKGRLCVAPRRVVRLDASA